MQSRTGPRILTVVAVATMIVSGVGFFVMLFLNPFVFDDYDRYGEVAIPGSGTVALPAGDVTVTFHTVLVGGSGNGLPVPALKYQITGPDGADLTLAEDYGGSTTVNNDARRRIGYLHVPVAGNYSVELDGNVSAFLDPSLAFGQGSRFGAVPWILAAVFGFAVVDLVVARVWAAKVRRGGGTYEPASTYERASTYEPAGPFTPTDQGVRIEQLNTLARLRESGALTEAEYDAEKKRVLDGL